MKRVPVRAAICCVLTTAAWMWVLSAMGAAQQTVPVTAGVYSTQQAERARPLYQSQCSACHGDDLQGGIGTPLTGPDFLAGWSGRSLADLVDKIQQTMPFNSPASLSRQQAIDLTAHILRVGQFPAAQADLTEAALRGISMPAVRAAAVTAPVTALTGSLPPPVGNLAELMRAVAFYNSNIIFNLPLKNPGTAPKKPLPVPFDYVEWGYTIYPGWLAVDQAAVALSETAPLLMTPGRRCQNGKPVPLNQADWKKYVDDLAKVGHDIYAASKARNYDTLVMLSDNLNQACANCHAVYRDKGGAEGSGGAKRCEVAP